MNVVFASNYFNHHQKFLSDAFYSRLGDGYTFVETQRMRQERAAGGWTIYKDVPYVLRTYEPDGMTEAERLIRQADVVITGSAPEALIRPRVMSGKLVFRYAERPLKDGLEIHKFLPRWIKWHIKNPRGKPIYMLCASGYTAGDYRKFGLFRGRCYKWGYFPEVRQYADIAQMQAAKRPASILWAGRLIGWKHPDASIHIAKRLKQAGYDFTLDIVGQGELYEDLKTMVSACGLDDRVRLLGLMTQEQVREKMEQSEIFLFTSDKKEGWGAVLNESMNSGCAVVASRAIGSVPYLIEDGQNGLIYEDGDLQDLYEKVRWLLDHPEERKRCGRMAYETMSSQWNADNAAERFLTLAEQILAGEEYPRPFAEGVCSADECI